MIKLHKRFFDEFKSSYMLMIPLTIILQSCYGSIVVYFALMQGGAQNIFALAIATVLCMGYNAAILAQLKTKVVFNLLLASLGINTLILILIRVLS